MVAHRPASPDAERRAARREIHADADAAEVEVGAPVGAPGREADHGEHRNASEDEHADVGHAPPRQGPEDRLGHDEFLDEQPIRAAARGVRTGKHVARVRRKVARPEHRAARLDEALVLAVDDHDDPRAAGAAGRFQDELALGGEPRHDAAYAPLCVADVAQRRHRDAAGAECALRRLLVVDDAVSGARVVGEQVGVVSPVETEHLRPDATKRPDHEGGASAPETPTASARPRRTARKKRKYSSSRTPRHFPRRTSNATVASSTSGYASTSD